MNSNLIKQLASYLWDIPIERTSSPQNNYLEVVWSNGVKMLNTKEANFSFGNDYKVFATAMKQIEEPINHARNILILGFGCGGIHHLLEKKYSYKQALVGVEYDADIIRLYKQHFAPKYGSKPQLCLQDAALFVKKNNNPFDIIFIDLFCELENSSLLESPDFLTHLEKACTVNGVLVFNTTTTNTHGEYIVFKLQKWLTNHFKTVSKTPFQEFNQILIAQKPLEKTKV
jgi:spermidine synthase